MKQTVFHKILTWVLILALCVSYLPPMHLHAHAVDEVPLYLELTPQDYLTVSNDSTEKLACGPGLVALDDGYFAVSYLADEVNTVETESSTTIVCRLGIFHISDPENGTFLDVATAGQTIGNVKIGKKAPYEPNLLKLNEETLVVLFNLRDTSGHYIYYSALFDTQTNEITSYAPLTLDGREWTPANVAASYNAIADHSISASGPSSSMVFTSKIVEHNGWFYGYCGGICAGFSGILVRSKDGINWESVLAPEAALEMNGVIECGFAFLDDHIYLCMRDISSGVYQGSYRLSDGAQVVKTQKMTGLTTSKPAAFLQDGEMYVIVNALTGDESTVARRNTALFYKVNPKTCELQLVKRVFCGDGCAYHTVVEYQGKNYWCFHTDARRINPYTQGRSNLAFLEIPGFAEPASMGGSGILNWDYYSHCRARGCITVAQNVWVSNAVNYSYQIPLSDFNLCDTVTITANPEQKAYIAFLSDHMDANGAVAYAEGWSETLIMEAGTTQVLHIPSDAEYLYIIENNAAGNSLLPSKVEFHLTESCAHSYKNSICEICGERNSQIPYDQLSTVWPSVNTDLTHIICYGQSFSTGSDAPYYADATVDGVYVYGNIANSAKGTALTALSASAGNQHPIISAGNVLAQLLKKAGYDTDIVLGSYGSGGKTIAQLMSSDRQSQIKQEEGYTYDILSSGRYEVFQNSVSALAEYAQKNDQSISCPAIVYLQGETDQNTDAQLGYPENPARAGYGAGGDKEKYKEYMSRLKEDMQREVMEQYGQTEKPLFLIYQVSGTYTRTQYSSINMAQIEFAQENEDVILVQSPYFASHYTNSHHLTQNGYRWLGEYIGRSIYTALVEREKPWPLLPERIEITGSNTVSITVSGAQNGLTIDTWTVENASNSKNLYGFYVQADGTHIVPSEIIIRGNTIDLVLPKDLTSKTAYVYYAGKNARGTGNIRDNSTALGFYDYLDDSNDTGTGNNQGVSHSSLDANGKSIIGQKYPLYNWLSSFCYEVEVPEAAQKQPAYYHWEMNDTGLVSVTDGDAVENKLTLVQGTVTDGLLNGVQYNMDQGILLKHDRPWVIEWKAAGNGSSFGGGKLLSSSGSNDSYAQYLYTPADSRGLVAWGVGDLSANYGFQLKEYGIDPRQEHIYRIENRIEEDGSNNIYLFVDGTEIGAMNTGYRISSNTSGAAGSKIEEPYNWANGKNLYMDSIGAGGSFLLKNMKLFYLKVWEAGEHAHSFKNGTCTLCNVSVLDLNYTHAVPQNQGVANAIERAYSLTDIEWTPVADMPGVAKIDGEFTVITYEAGVTYRGIPYSGTTATDTYVGLNVSLESFLTALENKNSVLYTENLFSTNPKSATYFGTVCSKFAQYVLDVPGSFNTNNVANIPGMDTIAMPGKFTVEDIQLGDVILHTVNHTSVCTDILYDADGKVAFIEVSEAVLPRLRRMLWSPEEFYEHFEGYRLCRYQYVSEVPPVETMAISQSYALMPRFGDKYNYKVSTTKGVVDILETGYSKAVVLRDGVKISEIALKETTKSFQFDCSVPGYLEMYLEKADGTKSGSVYACVVKSSVKVTDSDSFLSGKLTVSFDGTSGTPLYVQVGSGQSVFCSIENAQGKEATVSFIKSLVSGETIRVRVAYQNEYGIYLSSWISFRLDYTAGTGPNPSSDPYLSKGIYWENHNISPSSHLPQVQAGKENYWSYTMIPVEENTTYYSLGATRLWYLDGDGNPISTYNAYKDSQVPCQFTTPAGAAYVSIAYSPTLVKQGEEKMEKVGQHHEHSYQTTIKAPDCTEQGYTTHTCACGESYVDSYVDAGGHAPVTDPAIKANSARAGLTEGSHCGTCGAVLQEQKTIPAKGYEWMVEDGEFKILLIGNSFSQDAASYGTESQLYNILQAMLGEDVKITLGLLYSGGKGVHWHATQAEQGTTKAGFYVITPDNQKWANKGGTKTQTALSWTDWDVVTLQPYDMNFTTENESVPYPAETDEKFYPLEVSTEFMLDFIDAYAPQADVYCYMHWARSSSKVSTLNASLSTYKNFAAFYPKTLDYVGEQSGNRYVSVIPVALSVQNARTTYLSTLSYNVGQTVNFQTDPQIGLQRDGGHLTYNIGRYIAGLTFAETIIPAQMRAKNYVLPEIRVTESVGKLPAEYTEIAQKAVLAAVNSWKNGKLDEVTTIAGYSEDPTVAAGASLSETKVSVGCGVGQAQLKEAVLSVLPKDFDVENVNVAEGFAYKLGDTFSCDVTIRFGYTFLTVPVNFKVTEHRYTSQTIAPTCTAQGYTTYTCKCGYTYVDSETDALGHKWTAATCESAKTCAVCKKTEGSANGHKWNAATCETAKTCSVCKKTEGSAIGHKWNAATCETAKTCSACKKTEGSAAGHKWNAATCETAKTCSVCKKTEGSAIGHKWNAATCETAKTCSVCKKTEGSAIGHKWTAATCESAKTCSVCKKSEGSATGHKWNAATCETAKTCSVCKKTEGSAAGHKWTAATCESAKICSVCKKTEGAAAGHKWTAATCETAKTCSVCKKTEGSATGHKWTAATCETAKTCSVCKKTEGSAAGHKWNAATCETAKTCSVCKKTEGSAIGHKWNTATCETAKTCSVCKKTEGSAIGHKWNAATCETAKTCSVCKKTEGSAAGHKWSAATCETAKTCSVCKKTEGSASGHKWDSGTVTKPATETTEGVKTYKCSSCGKTRTETIPMLSHIHKYEKVVTKPTCTEQGYTTYTCKCGHTYVDNYTNATGHKAVTDKAVAETCTKSGLTAGSHCSVCGVTIKKQETVPAIGHTWDKGTVTKSATEETEGVMTYKCASCGESKTATIPMLSHTHKYEKVTTVPTCTEQGYSTFTCKCGHTYVDNYVKATGHKAVTDKAVAATCTKTGLTAGSHCSVCGVTIKAQEIVPATGHSWDKGTVTKPATEETEGVMTYKCTSCGEIKTATIPVLGHVHKYEAEVTEATCTENGFSTYTCACGDSYTDAVVEALGHDWIEATCLDPKTCQRCGTEEGEALGHSFSEWRLLHRPSCTSEGQQIRICDCGAEEIETIPMVDHDYRDFHCKSCNAELKEIQLGDVNGDNKLTYEDALKILRYSINLEDLKFVSLADINGDGNVNYSDALTILRKSIGLE